MSFNTIISVTVELKESVLDPAGEITHRSLDRLGYKGIEKVRLGKNAKLTFSIPPTSSLYEKAEEISNKILSNPLIESYSIDIKFEGK
ncbi:MAG: phosphoribosylformylglycinamidine synthase subunit PurS [Candidatus Heimdallarchaeaceae archaeon]